MYLILDLLIGVIRRLMRVNPPVTTESLSGGKLFIAQVADVDAVIIR
jgi:hypothetical protein